MDMRGLSNFIRDIREATASREAESRRVAEELGKIRAKFRDSTTMTPYDRKKYVCKLLFIFMLGYEVDFGHMEAIELLAGHSASEKLIGYLAISVLLTESHPLLMLTTHTMTVDLAKGSELQKTLALTAIANIGSKESVDSVAPHVVACLMSRTASVPVRKRAILAALHLFRKAPMCLNMAEVGPVIAGLVASQDYAVSTCACSFAEALLQHKESREHVLGAKTSALTKLYEVIVDRRTPNEYVQYQVPAPWLQVKLLRLLQHFGPPTDEVEADRLSLILCKIIKASEKVVAEVQHQMAFKRGTNSNRSNLFVATLVEACSLCILWDCDATALSHCRDALGVLISDKRDPNLKTLGLQLLARMSFCASYNFSEHVLAYQGTVVQALHDRDNSVRLRALDLLNAMCTRDNAANIVGELQEYLKVSHPTIREDLVLLIAVLAEKFCAEPVWYVEVLMYLLHEAGRFIPEDVWCRLVHIVVNTPSVQKHAVSLIMKMLADADHNERCSEVVVTVACLLLGEYGYQIALLPAAAPQDQLLALHAQWHVVSDATKATMLHCFAKFYNLYDDVPTRERIVRIFAAARSSLDAEVQQRATEYHVLVTACSDDVMLAALEPLPEFDVGADTLVARLRQRQHGAASTDLWSQKAQDRDERQMQQSAVVKPTAGVTTASAVSGSSMHASLAASRESAQRAAVAATAAASAASSAHADAYADVFGPAAIATKASVAAAAAAGPQAAIAAATATHIPALLTARTGRLLLDPGVIAVEVVAFDARAADVRMTLRLTNPSIAARIDALAMQIGHAPAGLVLQMQPPSATSIACGGGSVTVNFAARALAPFRGLPTAVLSFTVAGSPLQWGGAVPLPIAPSTFIEPYKTDDVARFQSMWDQLGSDPKTTATHMTKIAGVEGGMPAVEQMLALASHVHCFRANSAMIFAMGAFAAQPGDAVAYTAVLGVAQAAPGSTGGDFAVAFRSSDNLVSEAAMARFTDAAKAWVA